MHFLVRRAGFIASRRILHDAIITVKEPAAAPRST
jgi:hypothetical protein